MPPLPIIHTNPQLQRKDMKELIKQQPGLYTYIRWLQIDDYYLY